MNTEIVEYEAPAMVDMGEFSDVTRGSHLGYYLDFIGMWWF
ncbi:lasso RiPP family leader peptide-containing protein [Streptomyces sp. NBC_00868]|nr:lasso RiPP family leader peptide-containing protein [Streptomyces sp. NBC_00868]